jgi:hypothetical protein
MVTTKVFQPQDWVSFDIIQSTLNQPKINLFVSMLKAKRPRLTELSYTCNIVTRENRKCLKSHLAGVLANDNIDL